VDGEEANRRALAGMGTHRRPEVGIRRAVEPAVGDHPTASDRRHQRPVSAPAGRCGSAARRAAELVFWEMGSPLVLNVPLYGGLPSADGRTAK
jgi:hypothetical protein